jgi:predicted AAA+ superfamily ATPase
LYERFIRGRLAEALGDTPVVLLVGPRRAGKTTLARSMSDGGRAYMTLDDRTTLEAARSDPVAFVRGLDLAIVDEVQRVPELMLAIKKAVDDDYRPGRFLLAGSANVMTLPRVADSLAGRSETIKLLPLSRSEVLDRHPAFLDALFAGNLPQPTNVVVGKPLVDLTLVGGFPEAMERAGGRRRQDWGRSYLASVLTRDLRDIADVEKLTELPRFVRLLAEHAGQLVNYSELGKGIGVNYKTAQRYVGLLEQIFLVASLAHWHTNAIKRIVKTPKLHFLDSGLLATSRGLTADRLMHDRVALGALLETFVFAEIMKLMTWSDLQLAVYHFRDQDKNEVDLVLERDDGMVAGIEIKASATVTASDFSGIRKLADACGPKFVHGVVLYDGDTVVPFGSKLAAAPLSCLWN